MKREKGLLSQIEADVLDESCPVSSALRKCVVLGSKAGSKELVEWATKELRGYDGSEDLPAYRMVPAPILVNGTRGNMWFKGQRISPYSLPKVAHGVITEVIDLRQGIGEIETLAKRDEAAQMSFSGADLAIMMNHDIGDPFQHITEVYWSVASSALTGVVDQVRTGLAQIVGEMTASLPDSQEMPTAEAASQAVHLAVTGRGSTVTLNNAQSASGGSSTIAPVTETQTRFWSRSRKVGAFLVGAASVASGVAAVIQIW